MTCLAGRDVEGCGGRGRRGWARATSGARLRRAGEGRGAHRCGHLTNHGDARSAAAASACRCMWVVPSQLPTASERDPKAGTMKRCAWREAGVAGARRESLAASGSWLQGARAQGAGRRAQGKGRGREALRRACARGARVHLLGCRHAPTVAGECRREPQGVIEARLCGAIELVRGVIDCHRPRRHAVPREEARRQPRPPRKRRVVVHVKRRRTAQHRYRRTRGAARA